MDGDGKVNGREIRRESLLVGMRATKWQGDLKGGCSGRGCQGKVLKGALKGAIYCQGFGGRVLFCTERGRGRNIY